jgi:TusA-related sulfurtransferase
VEIDIVDARNLPCPQPVILVRGKMKELDKGTFIILVNTEIARDNVLRSAENRGWIAEKIEIEEDTFRITFKKD